MKKKLISFVTLSLLAEGLLVGTVGSSAQAETTTNVNITKASSEKTNTSNLFVSLS
ncbi:MULTISPECIES: hypothetical protein [Liquorilactobacillus]|jgi:hypothetical protein|uniref:hypothetical protein n=1 Tax=Liquorilactobacillus TaxID=2767888 RepID=UPI0024307FDD|nr:hypothetical protein [Liquorilactobacillus nagelii]MCI1699810.1 hypothetical protein [Liquorilactobacillus nagelii]